MSYTRSCKTLPISSLFSARDSQLGNLCQHINYLQNLENKLLAYLNPPLNEHCILANYTNNTLILHTDSPTWAAKLRYCIPEMLSYMQHECYPNSLITIRIKVIPLSKPMDKTTVRRLTISGDAASFINTVAITMSDSDLRTSLLKIGKYNT